jgi:hypothetical protein
MPVLSAAFSDPSHPKKKRLFLTVAIILVTMSGPFGETVDQFVMLESGLIFQVIVVLLGFHYKKPCFKPSLFFLFIIVLFDFYTTHTQSP